MATASLLADTSATAAKVSRSKISHATPAAVYRIHMRRGRPIGTGSCNKATPRPEKKRSDIRQQSSSPWSLAPTHPDDFFHGLSPFSEDLFHLLSPDAEWKRWTTGSFPVDVLKQDDEYVLVAEMPGLSEKDVNLRIEGRTLSISAETKESKTEERQRVLRMERRAKKYQRSFQLPKDVDTTGITATMNNGILTITVPRAVEAPIGREIPIQKAVSGEQVAAKVLEPIPDDEKFDEKSN